MYKEYSATTFDFFGINYTLCDNWYDYIPKIKNNPINYLEVGLNCGVNIILFCKKFGKHPKSKIYAIDPFLQDFRYEFFNFNIKKNLVDNKIICYRELCNVAINKIEDNSLDIIYIADNKDAKTTLENIVLSFVKLKENGYLIVDNYHNILEINMMVDTICYKDCYKFLGHKKNQFFIQKIKK